MTRQDDLTQYLNQWYAQQTSNAPFARFSVPPLYVRPHATPEQIAHELLADEEFHALRLANWFGRPDVQLMTRAVEAMLPQPQKAEVELIMAALQHAVTLQQEGKVPQAGKLALGVVAAAAFFFGLVGLGRPRTA